MCFNFLILPGSTGWNSCYLWGPNCDPFSSFGSSPTIIFCLRCRLPLQKFVELGVWAALLLIGIAVPQQWPFFFILYLFQCTKLGDIFFLFGITPSTGSCRDLDAEPDACPNKLCASSEFELISFLMDSTKDAIVCCWVSSNSLCIFLSAILYTCETDCQNLCSTILGTRLIIYIHWLNSNPIKCTI